MIVLTTFVVVAVTMLIEQRISASNERWLRLQGAVEPPDDVIHTMRWAYPAAFVAMLIEGAMPPGSAVPNEFIGDALMWVTLHEVGNVAGFVPALVMDVWGHAFILDYAPAERPKYIEAFFANIAWDVVARRLVGSIPARAAAAG